ncbi:hypothetical protein TL16_g08893 [Triparma laevis f. inornata]|uniref:Rab-GAP TBC domain-containing protein n=1 Tax=Triparma laevis f. inornata TaxID=1714386 RepID=A0A9W7B583_9STRA|nr:hypothetical protein TL16_g08893 [Triparma laevis f. inornata]
METSEPVDIPQPPQHCDTGGSISTNNSLEPKGSSSSSPNSTETPPLATQRSADKPDPKERAVEAAGQMLLRGDISQEEYEKIITNHNVYHSTPSGVSVEIQPPTAASPFSPLTNLGSMLTLFPQSQPSLKDTRATFAVRAANKARERQSRRKQKIDLQRQKEIVSDTAEWKRILEKELINLNEVKELCCRGIPPKVRGEVWSKMIGNGLCISKELWAIHEKRGNEMLEKKR